ncbi:MAG TPA: hypothetical protein VJ697_01890 [Nitrososphaeraceae archaeon]|nr:hypothetical protein [Nitrososphaeraceae archaeon]
MVNVKEENKKQINNIIEGNKDFLESQKQQLENTTSTISETSNKINENINQYQKKSQDIIDNNIDTSNKYQQETSEAIHSISNNFNELQNNIFNIYQSTFTRFLDDSTKSYWNNFMIPQRYTDIFIKNNQSIIDNAINATRKSHTLILASTETLNKSIEISQNYYNEAIQNYFNFINKLGRSFNY